MKVSVSVVLCTLLAVVYSAPSKLVARQVADQGQALGGVSADQASTAGPDGVAVPYDRNVVVLPNVQKRSEDEIQLMMRRGLIAVRGSPDGTIRPFNEI